jgi:hypothetical protein
MIEHYYNENISLLSRDVDAPIQDLTRFMMVRMGRGKRHPAGYFMACLDGPPAQLVPYWTSSMKGLSWSKTGISQMNALIETGQLAAAQQLMTGSSNQSMEGVA